MVRKVSGRLSTNMLTRVSVMVTTEERRLGSELIICLSVSMSFV